MKKNYLLILLFSCLFVSCIKDEKEGTDTFVEVGDTLPSFSVSSVDGKVFSYDKSIGKVTLIVFFDTTCGDCYRELPKAELIWAVLKTEPDFVLLPIARAQDRETVQKYWEERSFSMPAYLDPGRNIYALFAESVIPRFYLADKNGIVRWIGVEEFDEDAEAIATMIKELLEEK